MSSMIEILFYISLAATLFLMFLLINHLKTRIVTLETQNEGLMDIIKLLRGNMVSSDNQQKNINDRLVNLERNSSTSYTQLPSSSSYNRENITLEIKNVDMSNNVKNNKIEISDHEDEYVLPVYDLQSSDEDEEEDEENGNEGLETIDIPYPTDVSGFIDIQKMNYDDDEEEEGDENEDGEKSMKQIHELLQMQGIQGNEMQKMMMLMSIGQGFPGFASFSSSSSGFGELAGELEILEDEEEEEDYTDLPELVEDDIEVVSEIPVTEVVSEISVTEMVEEMVKERVEEVVTEIPVTETVSEVIEHDVEEISESSEEEIIDYHKLDVKTLRQMAQDLHMKENVKNLKKPEIIKLLSSQAKV